MSGGGQARYSSLRNAFECAFPMNAYPSMPTPISAIRAIVRSQRLCRESRTKNTLETTLKGARFRTRVVESHLGGCSETTLSKVGGGRDPGRRRRRGGGVRRDRKKLREHPGLRPASGHEVIRPLAAVRRAVNRQGPEEGQGDLLDHERPERPAEDGLSGGFLSVPPREGSDRHRHRPGHVDRDREEVRKGRRSVDRLRPPGWAGSPRSTSPS